MGSEMCIRDRQKEGYSRRSSQLAEERDQAKALRIKQVEAFCAQHGHWPSRNGVIARCSACQEPGQHEISVSLATWLNDALNHSRVEPDCQQCLLELKAKVPLARMTSRSLRNQERLQNLGKFCALHGHFPWSQEDLDCPVATRTTDDVLDGHFCDACTRMSPADHASMLSLAGWLRRLRPSPDAAASSRDSAELAVVQRPVSYTHLTLPTILRV